MFYRCSLECQHCGTILADTLVAQKNIPRVHLHKEAHAKGAVTDRAGRWYCGPACRAKFRLRHSVVRKDAPDVR